MIDYAIEQLTKMLIKLDFEEKKTGKIMYVKKQRAYKDLIKLLRDYEKINDFKNKNNNNSNKTKEDDKFE